MESKQLFGMTRRQFVTSSATVLAASGLTTSTVPLMFGSDSALARGPFRVIIDTDPGVDDALALLLAMRSPELKIEGITPVAGNVPLELTLPNALRLVEIAGRTDIPVAAGAKAPLARRLVTATYAHGEDGLGGAICAGRMPKPVAERGAEIVCARVRKCPTEVLRYTLWPLASFGTAWQVEARVA